jgi:hypothetical protein
MREFPDRKELSFLIGLSVSGVVFRRFTLDVMFDDNTVLQAEYMLEHVDERGECEHLDIQAGFGAVSLHKVVEATVTSIEREPLLLSLVFDNGHTLRIASELGPYESGNFSRGADVIVF